MTNVRISKFSDAFTSLALGLRNGISWRLILFSMSLWLGSILLWALVSLFAWAKIKAVAAFIAAWTLLGVFVLFPQWLPASAQTKLSGVPLATGAEALLGTVFHVVVWIVFPLLIIALVLITARIGLELFLMPLVRREVLKKYPPFPPCPTAGLLAPVRNIFKMSVITVVLGIPCFLIPVVNVVLLFVLFGYLNVRTLVNESLDGLASPEEQRAVIRTGRLNMILLGSLLAGAMTIPFVGFIGPSWIGASTCHLCLRTLQRVRSENPPILTDSSASKRA